MEAMRIIMDEHQALGAVLHAVRHLIGEIGAVLAGRAPARTSDADVTVYKSLGIAPQDLAAAAFVYRRAEETGTGTVVDLTA